MRLAGISPTTIAEDLCKDPVFSRTTPKTVWNDILWWERQGQITTLDPEEVTPDIYFDARRTIDVQKMKAYKRFLVFHDQFDELSAELRTIGEEDADEDRRPTIEERQEAIKGELATLQRQIVRETDLILSIAETLTDIPKKLGLIIDRKELGVYGTSEVIMKAIEKENDAKKQKEAIKAFEIIEEFLS